MAFARRRNFLFILVLPIATIPVLGQQQSSVSPSPAGIPAKVISFAIADQNSAVHPGMPGWIGDWVRKNSKKYPEVSFQEGGVVQGADNYLVVLSSSEKELSGFDPVVRTHTSTTTSPVSGSGTVTDQTGATWNYTFNGTVDTTTTTQTRENVPYTVQSRTICLTAYNLRGVIVTQRSHLYSTKEGGAVSSTLGHNLGNALRSINARSRLVDSVVRDIAGH